MEYQTPTFLKGKSAAEFYRKIREVLPADLDTSEGSHGYNLTYPVALIAAEICEFILPEVIRLIMPETSYGEYLDGHARGDALTRLEAEFATGTLEITGQANTTIPAGSLFSIPSVNNEPSVDYETTEEATIPDNGPATVPIRCTKAGTVGNTPANTIIYVSSKLTGITAVTNPEELKDGVDEETDEKLIARILEYDRTQGYSFVGNDEDYKRWAKEAGAGDATVVPPEDDSGLVTLIVTDLEGKAADEELISKVYNYIISPADRNERRAPIGAQLSVVPPNETEIGIKATIETEAGFTIESITNKFTAKMALYLAEALDEGEVKYSKVWAVLAATEGVNDFKDLQIGLLSGTDITYGTSNIPITNMMLPAINPDYLLLTEGTV